MAWHPAAFAPRTAPTGNDRHEAAPGVALIDNAHDETNPNDQAVETGHETATRRRRHRQRPGQRPSR